VKFLWYRTVSEVTYCLKIHVLPKIHFLKMKQDTFWIKLGNLVVFFWWLKFFFLVNVNQTWTSEPTLLVLEIKTSWLVWRIYEFTPDWNGILNSAENLIVLLLHLKLCRSKAWKTCLFLLCQVESKLGKKSHLSHGIILILNAELENDSTVYALPIEGLKTAFLYQQTSWN